MDAVVAGGGPAGAAVARRLALAGCRVMMVDPSAPGGPTVGEALAPAARPLLRDLGVWERFREGGHLPCYGNDSAWGSSALAGADFVFDPNGHGWHLDRARFDASLRAEAAAAGADVRPGRLRGHAPSSGGGWEVTLDDGTVVGARWLIDATGRRAAIARHRGARRRAFDTTVALVARAENRAQARVPSADRDARTLIEAGPDGWWYSGLVPGGDRVVTYVSDRDLLPPSIRTTAGFAGLVQGTRYVRRRLRSYALVGRPRHVAAGGAATVPPAGEGWVAVGDAALAVDPLSSQGILVALYTGMVAADAVLAELAGAVGAVPAYVDRVESVTAAYRRNVARFYGLERRWPDRSFWRRRHAPSSMGAT